MRLDDINAVVAYDYIRSVHPDLVSPDLPGLAAGSLQAAPRDEAADHRSWRAMQDFFAEIFE